MTEVARSLVFSSKIQDMADRIINAMTHGGQKDYNAVHLRIEKDARDWSTIMGGEAVSRCSCNLFVQRAIAIHGQDGQCSGLQKHGMHDSML